MPAIRSYKELRVYQLAMDAAMKIFELSKRFPVEEKYSLTDQMRRSSRSVCTNVGEAWRKRRYPAHFVSKMSDSEGEAEETRVWIEIAALQVPHLGGRVRSKSYVRSNPCAAGRYNR